MCKNNLAYLTAQNWLKNKKKVEGGEKDPRSCIFSVQMLGKDSSRAKPAIRKVTAPLLPQP